MLRIWLATMKGRGSWPIIPIIHITVHKLAGHPPSPLTLKRRGEAFRPSPMSFRAHHVILSGAKNLRVLGNSMRFFTPLRSE